MRHMIVNIMYCSHLKIDPNAHQGKEATEHLSEHKRRLQMDAEAESHEMNACHVKVTKISYIYISIYFLIRENSRLGSNMANVGSLLHQFIISVVSLKENAVFHKDA